MTTEKTATELREEFNELWMDGKSYELWHYILANFYPKSEAIPRSEFDGELYEITLSVGTPKEESFMAMRTSFAEKHQLLNSNNSTEK